MNFILNILWLLLGGLIAALLWVVAGLLLMITIIGIPFGYQLFKLARLMLWPFGNEVETNFDKHPVLNIIRWIIGGWSSFLFYIGVGITLCITIIGIPFGLQWFKLSKLALLPFGATIKQK